jgi:hypothetical protein
LTGALLAFAALAAAGPASRAAACSLAPLSNDELPFMYEDSSVVAVGRLEDAQTEVITLVVEEGLKNAKPGDRVRVYNRALGLGPDCSMYFDASAPGNVYPAGVRVVAFLKPGKGTGDKLWPAAYGQGVLEIEGDALLAPGQSQGPPKVADITAAIARAPDLALDPAIEATPPCQPLFYVEERVIDYLKMSHIVVDATVESVAAGRVVLRTGQYFRGKGGPTLTVNVHWFSRLDSCKSVMEEGIRRFAVGQRVIAFLQPDEFGVADWRPSVWGAGILYVTGERAATWPLPSLSAVRAAAPAAAAPAEPGAAPGQPHAAQGERNRPWLAAAALAAVTVGAGVVIALRSRRHL